MSMKRFKRRAIVSTSCALLAGAAAAQPCTPEWRPFDPTTTARRSIYGSVNAMTMWDPDGTAGPLRPIVAVGGDITMARNSHSFGRYVTGYDQDARRWVPIGTGTSWGMIPPFPVYSLAGLRDGQLAALSVLEFRSVVNVWNGHVWTSITPNTSGAIHSLVAMPNGDLIAGGDFSSISGVTASRIARWDGSTWSPLGQGTNSGVRSLAVLPSGELVVGGFFTQAGTVASFGIARWNGSTWSSIQPRLNVVAVVSQIAPRRDGGLVVGGRFGPSYNDALAQWNGSQWTSLGTGVATPLLYSSPVWALAALPNDDVVVGGVFNTAGGQPANRIARWDGSQWHPMGSGLGPTPSPNSKAGVWATLVLPNGDLLAGGDFTASAPGEPASVARWNGTEWSSAAYGVDGAVEAILTGQGEEVIVGGTFEGYGASRAVGIARWEGSAWGQMGPNPNGSVHALARLPDGQVLAGGNFTSIGGVQADRIARWDGAAWHAFGEGISSTFGNLPSVRVEAIAALPGGDVVVAGSFNLAGGAQASNIARWDGSTWHRLGEGVDGVVEDLLVLPGGDLVAAGLFRISAGPTYRAVLRWNGATWSPIGNQTGTARSIDLAPNGDLIAGGSNVGGLSGWTKRWDGSQWLPLGAQFAQSVSDVRVLPNGQVLVAGTFNPPAASQFLGVARWDGNTWQLDRSSPDFVATIALMPSGEMLYGGAVMTVGTTTMAGLARYSCPPCYANCDQSGTSPVLNAQDFLCFLSRFRVAQTQTPAEQVRDYANCDGSTAVPVLNTLDFACFFNRYRAGCP